jgi:outer membrane immunogenic protein
MSRNLLTIGGVSTLLIAVPLSAASAADMGMPLKASPPPPPPIVSWTGCYLDGGVGYGVWNQDHSMTGPFGPGGASATTVTTTDGGRGWLGRFGGGCDYQTPLLNNSIVIGAFGDYDGMSLTGSNSPSELFPPAGPGNSPITANLKETGAWYVGGRIGYLPFPNLMTFFSGGWTGTRFTSSPEFQTATGAPIGFTYPGSYTVNGWFLGGGYEYKVPWVSGLFWKTEYRFAEYQSINLAEASLAGVPDGNIQHSQSYVQTVTTSLVWKFNWGVPIVTGY